MSITTCTHCGTCYEASSEETANKWFKDHADDRSINVGRIEWR